MSTLPSLFDLLAEFQNPVIVFTIVSIALVLVGLAMMYDHAQKGRFSIGWVACSILGGLGTIAGQHLYSNRLGTTALLAAFLIVVLGGSIITDFRRSRRNQRLQPS